MRSPGTPIPSTIAWRVRSARSEDRTFILRLVPRLADGFPLPPWRTQEEVVRAEAATLEAALEGGPNGARLLVAESSAGQPGGFVYLEQHIDYFRQAPYAHVAVLAVAAEVE